MGDSEEHDDEEDLKLRQIIKGEQMQQGNKLQSIYIRESKSPIRMAMINKEGKAQIFDKKLVSFSL